MKQDGVVVTRRRDLIEIDRTIDNAWSWWFSNVLGSHYRYSTYASQRAGFSEWLEENYGIKDEPNISTAPWNWEIVDQEKYTLFVLKWAS